MVPRLEPCATARHAFPATTVTLPWQARLGIELGTGDGTGVGSSVGARLGFDDGALVGSNVGANVGSDVGASVGSGVGASVGSFVGAGMGSFDGAGIGSAVGAGMGSFVGAGIGSFDGAGMGTRVGSGVVVGASVGADDTDVQMRIWSMSATEVTLCSLILITSPKEYGTTVVTRFAAASDPGLSTEASEVPLT